MANKGTPRAGLAEIARRVFVVGEPYQLVCYTNTQDSLGDASAYADLVQPTETNGYAPITLAAAGWTVAAGVETYQHPAGDDNDGRGNPCWYASGDWSAPVTGVALVSGGVLQHFSDLIDSETSELTTFVGAAGKALAITVADLLENASA